MKHTAILHVAWRDGRPRFSPGPRLRALGHAGYDLRHNAPGQDEPLAPGHGRAGRWFTRGEAVDWSAAFAAALKAPRKRRRTPAPARPAYSIERLFSDWFNSDRFRADSARPYARKTVEDYRQKARVLETHDPVLWRAPVAALTRPICAGLFEQLQRARGLATARGALLVLGSAIEWAMLRGKLPEGINPAHKLRMPAGNTRMRFASRAEIEAMIAAADETGLPHVGDMIMLGVWTGQRQNDRLAMRDEGLHDGRRRLRQSKTGALVEIAESPMLAARLAAARARRAGAGVAALTIVADAAGQPLEKRAYNAHWNTVRAAAAKTQPSVRDLNDGDLRRTAVTWLALAGATIPEICAITGHTLASANDILKHYLVLNPAMGDTAIRKLVEWFEGKAA